jgi:hypothetical protein
MSNVGKKVGDDIFDTFDVLRCEAAVGVENCCGEVPGREEVRCMGWSISSERSRLVQPSDCGCVVSQGKDARVDRTGVGCATAALEPHTDYHPQELEEVVDSRVAENETVGRDSDSPSLPGCEAVSSHSEGAGIGPTDPCRFPGGDKVYGHPLVGFDQECLPEFQVLDDFVGQFESSRFSDSLLRSRFVDPFQEVARHWDGV